MGSGSHLDRVGCVLQVSFLPFSVGSLSLFLQDCDRESASNTAMAGYSLTGSVASSYLGHQRLEVKNLSQKISTISFCPGWSGHPHKEEVFFLQ